MLLFILTFLNEKEDSDERFSYTVEAISLQWFGSTCSLEKRISANNYKVMVSSRRTMLHLSMNMM